jgi:hypothetical protein
MLFTIVSVITTICFLLSLFFIKNDSWGKYFIPFMALTAAVEWTGYILFFRFGYENYWLYNAYLLVEICFLFSLLNSFTRVYTRSTRWFIAAWLIFIALYLWESSHSRFREYSGYANLYASVCIIIACFFFYYFLMKQPDYINIMRYGAFWVISGLFFFYLGSVACNVFKSQLTQVYEKTGLPIRYIIMLVLNIFLYSCWSYAFLCRYQQKISSSL